MSENIIEVPWQDIDAETLLNLITEFVTRDGTDYGVEEVDTEQKIQQVLAGLKSKRWLIVFDTDMQQCNVVDRDSWAQIQSSSSI